jgi:hypothetical protein
MLILRFWSFVWAKNDSNVKKKLNQTLVNQEEEINEIKNIEIISITKKDINVISN